MPLDPDAAYLALKTRDARFDGRLFVGVTSTGIYCRPVCRVRTPRRENCRFFDSAAQAEAAAFRPCLKCRPGDRARAVEHGLVGHAGQRGGAPHRRMRCTAASRWRCPRWPRGWA